MGTFAIKMDETDRHKIESMLGEIKDAGARATMRAVNKTLAGVKTDASSAIRAQVTAKKKAVDETFKILKATVIRQGASIASTGRPIALIDYAARETKKGVSVQVLKSRPRKLIPGTFMATMKSGHQGVIWRRWHGEKKAVNPNINYSRLPKIYRLPMKERFGPRVPDIMSNDPVMTVILAKAGERLHKNVEHEIDYELSKLK